MTKLPRKAPKYIIYNNDAFILPQDAGGNEAED